MEHKKIDIIIPTYRPGNEFSKVLERLAKQNYPIHKIIVMNTEKDFWDENWEESCDILEVHHLCKEEFDHGGTRKQAAKLSDAEIMVYMTQDALPADKDLIGNLIAPILEHEKVAASYARQLPNESCNYLEKYTRAFNYPKEGRIKSKEDLPIMGIKTYFCSNVCAAYSKDVYELLDGFVERTIFNEDMIYAGKLVQNDYQVAYASEAKVIHSHNYSGMQQFHRNFDLGVSQAEHPEIFEGVPSEGEGIRMVKKTAAHLCKNGRVWMIPKLFYQSACKYAGYLAGKKYRKLPRKMVLWCTMSRNYWK